MRMLRLAFCAVALICAIVLQLPPTASGAIATCQGATGADYTFTSSGYTGSLEAWGGNGFSICFGNNVVGLRQLKSFTYWVGLTSGSTRLRALAVVLDATNNAVVASVNVTALLPDTVNDYQPVEASFDPPVALHPYLTYRLELCATDQDSDRRYAMQYNGDSDDAAICNDSYDVCISTEETWESLGTPYHMRTNITGQCDFSSAAQLSLPVWLAWCVDWLTTSSLA